ncbi:MAG TPA: PadR family transcriptional regulator [Clostridia bacterium]|nr:PadR family transcriptional regulator [Clostridia bacterium]
MAKENKTIYAILGFLNHEEMTGYDIKKRIDTSLKYFWDAGFGQIYPSLKTLEQNGLVQCRSMASSTGPERITYSITDKGRKELADWLSKPVEKEQTKYEILLKLFFGSAANKEDNIGIISEFKQRNAETLGLFEAYGSELGKILDGSDDHVYYYLTVLFGQKVMKAYLEWADEAIEILGSRK